MNTSIAISGYALSGLMFLVLAILARASWRRQLQGTLLIVAAVASAAWAGLLAYGAITPNVTRFHIFIVEMLRFGGWLLFLIAVVKGGIGSTHFGTIRHAGVALMAAIFASGVAIEYAARLGWTDLSMTGPLIYGSMLLALYALVLTEQVFRNARESQRTGLNYLCLAFAGMFTYDLVLYSNAALNGYLSPLLWESRGFVFSMCVPLIALAAKSTPSWSVGIFVSRQIVFYTTTLMAAGVYLTSMALAGYYVRLVGGDWGSVGQIVLAAGTLLGLVIFAGSPRIRARLRVFIAKHFFANKYDYREEWLRLIDTLTAEGNPLPLRKRGIKALAQILEAPAGVLWLRNADGTAYRCVSGWNVSGGDGRSNADDPLPLFLASSGWIVEVSEQRDHPEKYPELNIDAEALGIDAAAYIVPLIHDGLFGFVVLSMSAARPQLNFEDHDLLKTAGQQIASYLAQEEATDQLAESRQFEAFSKLTAYIMHDLRNVMAQQSLIIDNAAKHKNNPEFIDDAIETLNGGIQRMRRVMNHLQQGGSDKDENIDIGSLVRDAIAACSDRKPVPVVNSGDNALRVRGSRDRLFMAVCHAIRNAQDATPVDGSVEVEVCHQDGQCSIIVRDTGAGMDERFIEERLFRPFDSTKGTQGMGIGAHQIRETILAAGGQVSVTSRVAAGTEFSIYLPLQTSDASAEKLHSVGS
jgi:putative PEP-CTERM system histidine kinase